MPPQLSIFRGPWSQSLNSAHANGDVNVLNIASYMGRIKIVWATYLYCCCTAYLNFPPFCGLSNFVKLDIYWIRCLDQNFNMSIQLDLNMYLIRHMSNAEFRPGISEFLRFCSRNITNESNPDNAEKLKLWQLKLEP